MSRSLRLLFVSTVLASALGGRFGAAAPAAPAAPAGDEVLRRVIGDWDATIQMAGEDGTEPVVMNGSEISYAGAGGAWVTSEFRGLLAGRPFQGHAILARDAKSGRYRRLWADSTASAFWTSEGTYDAATATLTMWIETTDSEGHPARWRETTTWKDDITRTFTMYVPGPEKSEASAMVIYYHRRKDPAGFTAPTGGPAEIPGDAGHAFLARAAGLWKASVDDRLDPAHPLGSFKAAENDRLCCGGLFLLADLTGDDKHHPFIGHGLLGYDTQRKKFMGAWVDSGNGTLVLSEGDLDAAANSLALKPAAQAKTAGAGSWREVRESKGADQRSTTIYIKAADGRETAGRTIKYRRDRP